MKAYVKNHPRNSLSSQTSKPKHQPVVVVHIANHQRMLSIGMPTNTVCAEIQLTSGPRSCQHMQVLLVRGGTNMRRVTRMDCIRLRLIWTSSTSLVEPWSIIGSSEGDYLMYTHVMTRFQCWEKMFIINWISGLPINSICSSMLSLHSTSNLGRSNDLIKTKAMLVKT